MIDPVVGTLLGTVLGTVLGGCLVLLNSWAQARRAERADHQRFLLAKAEELYELIVDVRGGMDSAWADTNARIALARANSAPLPERPRARIPFERVQALIALHFRELREAFDRVLFSRDPLSELIARSITDPTRVDMDALLGARCEFVIACDELLAELVPIATSLAPKLKRGSRRW